MRREGLKVRRLPAKDAEAEKVRDCCGAVNDAKDVVGVVLVVAGVIVEVVEVWGNVCLIVLVVVVVVVLRRERMAEENGRLDWAMPEVTDWNLHAVSKVFLYPDSRLGHHLLAVLHTGSIAVPRRALLCTGDRA